jgi:hypothetical protein
MPRKPTEEEAREMGEWAIWALRQPNALELFRERGAKCHHGGPVCEDCLEEARVVISQITNGQEHAEG